MNHCTATYIEVGIHHNKVLTPGLVGMNADAKSPWMGLLRRGSEGFGVVYSGDLN